MGSITYCSGESAQHGWNACQYRSDPFPRSCLPHLQEKTDTGIRLQRNTPHHRAGSTSPYIAIKKSRLKV